MAEDQLRPWEVEQDAELLFGKIRWGLREWRESYDRTWLPVLPEDEICGHWIANDPDRPCARGPHPASPDAHKDWEAILATRHRSSKWYKENLDRVKLYRELHKEEIRKYHKSHYEVKLRDKFGYRPRGTAVDFETEPAYVYCLTTVDDEVMYIGQTVVTPEARLRQHRTLQPWASLIHQMISVRVPAESQTQLDLTETFLIHNYHPWFNKQCRNCPGGKIDHKVTLPVELAGEEFKELIRA